MFRVGQGRTNQGETNMARSKKVQKPVIKTLTNILDEIEELARDQVLTGIENCFVADQYKEAFSKEAFKAIEITLEHVYDKAGEIHDQVKSDIDRTKVKLDQKSEIIIDCANTLADLLQYESGPDTLFQVRQILGEFLK
jgi:hypothetical protein